MIVGLLCGFAPEAWPGGGAGGPPSCQTKPGPGATVIRGTVSVEADSSANAQVNVDLTARLTRSGATKFFHFTLFRKVFGETPEQIVCFFLQTPAFSQKILTDLGLDPALSLVISDKGSLSNGEVPGPDSVFLDSTLTPNAATRASGMADVIIYAQ
jgi:hypothetical protein